MNKAQLDYLLEKVKMGEAATVIAKIIEAEHEAKIRKRVWHCSYQKPGSFRRNYANFN